MKASTRSRPARSTRSTRGSRTSASTTAGPHKIGVAFLRRTFAESDDRLPDRTCRAAARIACAGRARSRSAVRSIRRLQRDAEPARIFICYPNKRARLDRAPRRSSRTRHGARFGGRRESRPRGAVGSTRGRGRRRFRGGHSQRAHGRSSRARIPVSRRARAAERGAGSPIGFSDLELASRLSFFLWSSVPDDELRDVAAQGRAARAGGAATRRSGGCSPTRVAIAREQLRVPVAALDAARRDRAGSEPCSRMLERRDLRGDFVKEIDAVRRPASSARTAASWTC